MEKLLTPGHPWPMWEDMKDWPIWRCTGDRDLCDHPIFVWPEPGPEDKTCPDCEIGKVEKVENLTFEQAHDLAEELGGDVDILIPQPPPFELVLLTDIPPRMWMGLPIFVAGAQKENKVDWWHYDTGIIMEVWDDTGGKRVRFMSSRGGKRVSTLNYAAVFCWVPKPLADRLLMTPIEQLSDGCRDD